MGAYQLSLLGVASQVPAPDAGFTTLRRRELGRHAWVDYAPRWLCGDALLLDALRLACTWRGSRRLMYERFVDVPRLLGTLPPGGHPCVTQIAELLSARYDASFDAVSLGLYRTGRDSVAWHRDQGLRDQPESTMAIVSLGDPRPFRLRPLGGGVSTGFRCGWGDLVVLGGTIQRGWEHAIPKVANAGPRMALMLRCREETSVRASHVATATTAAHTR